jgi:hypothetical protein
MALDIHVCEIQKIEKLEIFWVFWEVLKLKKEDNTHA